MQHEWIFFTPSHVSVLDVVFHEYRKHSLDELDNLPPYGEHSDPNLLLYGTLSIDLEMSALSLSLK